VTIVQGGGAGTSTIAITPSNGFSGSVSLSATGMPNGVTAGVRHESRHFLKHLDVDGQRHGDPRERPPVTITGTSGRFVSHDDGQPSP